MRWSATYVLFAVTFYIGIEVETSGIDKFIKDDQNVLKQFYSRTSDKDIYGAILPASVVDTGDKKKAASDKKERILFKYNEPASDEFGTSNYGTSNYGTSNYGTSNYDTSNYGNRYSSELTTQSQKLSTRKPPKSTINFVSYHKPKPISQGNTQHTHNFLKNVHEFSNEENSNYPKSVRGPKPYYGHNIPEENDAYKSIQDILDDHEKNNRDVHKKKDGKVKYFNSNFKNKITKPPKGYNKFKKPRCIKGKCRQKGGFRSRKRPYRSLKAVKKVVLY